MTDHSVIPNEVHVLVLNEGDGAPIPGVAVLLTAKVPRKNSYPIGPKITNEHGRAVFVKGEVEREIALCRRAVIMDYACGIDEVYAIEAAALSLVEIDGLVRAAGMWGQGVPEWRLPEEMVSALGRSPDCKSASAIVRRESFEPIVELCIEVQP